MIDRSNIKGWFTVGSRQGDRTLGQQLVGLDRLFAAVPGKSVLDLGCAEGLISMECARHGALSVQGVEIRADHVAAGRKLGGSLPVALDVGDLNTWRPQHGYDVVLALALLHKLKNPSAACAEFCEAARELVVIRTPPKFDPWVIVDGRSSNKPHDIGKVLRGNGFKLSEQLAGTFGEVIGYWERT
jgi:2-polyprenyl-3-methyl-5-hydroxy-6-metoxy-1,4-benzoquinol methylase